MCPSSSTHRSYEDLITACSEEDRTTLSELGRAARELATTTLTNELRTAMTIDEIAIATTSSEEMLGLSGETYVVATIELTTPDGRAIPSALFIGQDDANLLFNLTAVEGDDMASVESNLELRVGEIIESFVQGLNLELERLKRDSRVCLTAVDKSVDGRTPFGDDMLDRGGRLLRLSYNLVLPNIMATEIDHIAPVEFLARLVSSGGDAPIDSPDLPVGASATDEWKQDVSKEEPRLAVAGSDAGSSSGDGRANPLPKEPMPDQFPSLRLPSLDENLSGREAIRGAAPVVRPAVFGPIDGNGDIGTPTNLDIILDVSLKVTVELGRTQMNVKDILALGPGSVVELEKLAGEPVDILINDRAIAKGEVVVVDENFGVRVTDIITPVKRVASLR